MEPPVHDANAPGVVLIADDNSEARRMLELRVKREGYAPILVENGAQALEVLAWRPVDVILLDIYMPEKDGFQVLAQIKQTPYLAHVPVLMISGGGDQEDLIRCIEMGAVDYLPKPFNQAVLRARLTTCLAAKRRRDQELQVLPPGAATPAHPIDASTIQGSRSPCALTSPSDVQHPQAVGRIALKRLLGSGSMGHVYLGHHELLDLETAVKLLRPELLRDAEMRARILREAQVTARINHRNIVRLLEVGESPRGLYLAYEFVNGGTLDDLLDRQPDRQLSIPVTVRILREIATGLAEINWLSITHRDLKPSNILLTLGGEVKIADLGLAKSRETKPLAPKLTAEHLVVGTPTYMAPEQARGERDLDIRTDLYALGIVLYEMLTGRPPFVSEQPMATLMSHISTPVASPRLLRAEIPPWLEAVCLKLTAKAPNDRYAIPEALLADIQANGG